VGIKMSRHIRRTVALWADPFSGQNLILPPKRGSREERNWGERERKREKTDDVSAIKTGGTGSTSHTQRACWQVTLAIDQKPKTLMNQSKRNILKVEDRQGKGTLKRGFID